MQGYTSTDGRQRARRIGAWARDVAREIAESRPASVRAVYDLDGTVDGLRDDVAYLSARIDRCERTVTDAIAEVKDRKSVV